MQKKHARRSAPRACSPRSPRGLDGIPSRAMAAWSCRTRVALSTGRTRTLPYRAPLWACSDPWALLAVLKKNFHLNPTGRKPSLPFTKAPRCHRPPFTSSFPPPGTLRCDFSSVPNAGERDGRGGGNEVSESFNRGVLGDCRAISLLLTTTFLLELLRNPIGSAPVCSWW